LVILFDKARNALSAWLERRSKKGLVALATLAALVVAWVDYETGTEISVSVFYLIPIALVAWFASMGMGILVAFICAGLWLSADILGGHKYSHPLIIYWNCAVWLAFFLIVCVSVASLREYVEQLRATLAVLERAVAGVTGIMQRPPDSVDTEPRE